jgi:hypothetical protein
MVTAMMHLFCSEQGFQISARSVEGHFWNKRYLLSQTAVAEAIHLGMSFFVSPQLVLVYGSLMPDAPKTCVDDECRVKDTALSALGFTQVARWRPGPASQIA